MSISAKDVAELRKATGAGVMDAKQALTDAKGDQAKAAGLLKERGLAKAAKKGEREAGEGLVHSYIHGDGRIGVLLELRCETDFVARNEEFQGLANDLCLHVAANSPATVEGEGEDALLNQPFVKNPDQTVSDVIKGLITKLGENIQVARFVRYELGSE
jgi:elongation factor Ts